MRIVTVVGARPQFVKAAVLSRAIRASNAAGAPPVAETLVHTGQHYDPNMSDVFFEQMDIPRPAYHLGVSGGSHGRMTGRMLEQLDEVLEKERPDAMVVFGDTNSTLAGALAAAKMHIPVAHVEAGLRSRNLRMAEEINRILADRISRWLFCPTETAADNLLAEGVPPAQIHRVGDVMYDAVLHYRSLAAPSLQTRALAAGLAGGFCLSTLHRAENTDDPARLAEIFGTLESIAAEMPVVLPLHPRTRKQLAAHAIPSARVSIVDPLSYFDMLFLLDRCGFVLTDSGGLQKEAYFCERPCLTLREETEWVELVELGVNLLGGTRREGILDAWRRLRAGSYDFSRRPYGDGRAGDAILGILREGPGA